MFARRLPSVAIGGGLTLFAGVMLLGPSAAVADPGAPFRSLGLRLPDSWITLVVQVAAAAGAAGVTAGLVGLHRGWRPSPRRMLGLGWAVAALFAVLPPAGSTDVLNYAMYGRIAALGRDPYLMTPYDLRALGDPVGVAGTAAWDSIPSVYGPLGTALFAVAACVGGASLGWIVLCLKFAGAVAYGVTALLLDRLAGPDPERRARAALLWTVNPLPLFWLVASPHLDVFVVLCVVGGFVLMKRSARVAGAFLGLAATFKIPAMLLLLGLRRVGWWLIAGALAVALPIYALGPRSLMALSERLNMSGSPPLPLPDGLTGERLLYGTVLTVAAVVCMALLWRALPPAYPQLPAARPMLIVAVAWALLAPVQFPWYDAPVFALLALVPASRLDWLALAHCLLLSRKALPGVLTGHAPVMRPGSTSASQWALALILAAVVAVCLRRSWMTPASRTLPVGVTR